MDIHKSTFADFIALGLSPAGLDEAERLILSSSRDPQQADLIKWLFRRIRGSRQENKPDVVLSPADELYLEGLLSLIDQASIESDLLTTTRLHRTSSKLDFLYFTRSDSVWSAIKALNFFYRSNIRPNRKAAVVVCVRNEAVNILEWIAHYRAFGFEEFFFYVNDSDDGTVELLTELARSGVCHAILNETNLGRNGADHFPIQSKGLEHAIHFLNPLREFEWVFFPDVDEFLVTQTIRADPVAERPLDDLLQRLDDQPDSPSGVLFNWKWFGSNSAYSREEGLVLERFCNCRAAGHVKTFARLSRCLAFPSSHCPKLPFGDRVLDGALRPVPNSAPEMQATYEYGQVNHYWNKSFEEFVAKLLRSWSHRSFENFFTWGNNRTFGHFESLPAGWINRVREEMKLLRSLPGVERHHGEAERRFRQSIDRYSKEQNLPAVYISERFGAAPHPSRGADSGVASKAGVIRHVVAPSGSRTRQPLLPGTQQFAAPWLRHWHEQVDRAAAEEIACYSVEGAVVSRFGTIWHENEPLWPLDLSPQGTVTKGRPDPTLPIRTVQSPCMVIPGHPRASYGDQVWDWMLGIGIARNVAMMLNLSLRLLLDVRAPAWVLNLIKSVWGLGPDTIETYDPEVERVFLPHVLVPADSLGLNGFHPFLNALIDEMAAYKRPFPSARRISRIFLMQPPLSQLPVRQCLNELELVQLAVRRHDFMPLTIENVSWLGQIKLFGEADIVINNSDLDIKSAIFRRRDTLVANVGFRTLFCSEVGSLRGLQNAYFMLGTESTSRYRIDPKLFANFLDALCA
jgi:hypothetical protein